MPLKDVTLALFYYLQLELLFENCQSLLSEMRDVTVQVAGNLGAEAAAVAAVAAVAKAGPKQQLEQQLESLGQFTSPGVILTLLDYKIIDSNNDNNISLYNTLKTAKKLIHSNPH